ncbi:MAG: heme-binding protein [Burkholderiales bacterium]|nr:heme-binding protein [Burkholderiales bacterium]
MRITLEAARRLVAAAQEKARAQDRPITVAVVDAGGFLVALERMQGARPLTPQICTAKAYTAVVMERPSAMLRGWAEHEPVFFNQVARMGQQPIVATQGGIPIKQDGELIGGMGVAGSTAEDDQKMCEEALRACGYELDFAAFNRVAK